MNLSNPILNRFPAALESTRNPQETSELLTLGGVLGKVIFLLAFFVISAA